MANVKINKVLWFGVLTTLNLYTVLNLYTCLRWEPLRVISHTSCPGSKDADEGFQYDSVI